jgi:putative MATE family efflux protein
MDNNYLIKEKEGKLLLKFSIPCILSLLIAALYNIVDQIFIGNAKNVGAIGNTATTIVYPLTVICLAFGLMFGDGAASLMSLESGKGEGAKNHKIVGNSILCGIIVSIVLLLICFPLLTPILKFFGARDQESLDFSSQYGQIILIGVPFSIIMTLINSIIRADGSPQIAMISMVLGAIINIVLDGLLINNANLGIRGAALATIIGQFASFIVSIIYLIRPKTFKLKLESFKPHFEIITKFSKLGFSSLLTQLAIVVLTIVAMNAIGQYGASSKYGVSEPQAIFGIVTKLFAIIINISVGIAAGSQPLVGYNFGAGEYKRVKKFLTLIVVSNIIIGLLSTLLLQLFPSQIISIFGTNTKNPDLYLEFGVKAIRIYLMLITLTLLGKVTAIYLQASNSPLKAAFLSLLRDIITVVPAMFILPISLGLDGVLWAAPVADIITAIVTITFIILEYKKLNKLIKEKNL